jgi:hypothetical protein
MSRTMRLASLVALSAAMFAAAAGGAAGAVPLHGQDHDPVDGPMPEHQHGGDEGHLPPGSRNMELVSKLKLTDVDEGIADVAAFGNYAYLNKFSPECVGNGGSGTGVEVVDISDPTQPNNVAFIPAHQNSYVGEGIHVVRADTPSFQGDILIHNNETCNATEFAPSGASLWDVTDPANPQPLSFNFGDADPAVAGQAFHTTHSAQLFVQRGVLPGGKDRVIATLQDNQDLADVDIFDVSNPRAPVMLSERGLEDWPDAQGSYANGDTVFHHDMQHKRIGGNDYLLVSYWDAGQVLLNIDDPANPVFVGDSDYRTPDPLMPAFEFPEGNSHQGYWDSDAEFVLSTDEDFSPFRTNFELTTGGALGPYGAGEFGFTPPIDSQPDGEVGGPTVFGGRGCLDAGENAGPDAVEGEPAPPPASAIPAEPGEEKTVVFTRGGCFFSTKIAAGQDLGYDVVIIGQSHGGTRNGLLPDAFFCGGQGHDYDEQSPAICIGHRATHLMFNDPPEYAGPEGADIPVGTVGERYTASTEFDGWGYVQLHDARDTNLRIIDSYAVPEALDEEFAQGFGDLSVHEVKTDPRENVNLAYISYYSAGARVVKFDRKGMVEKGFFIDEGGNNFWGTFPHRLGKTRGAPLLLFSDRDHGLYILRYVGD